MYSFSFQCHYIVCITGGPGSVGLSAHGSEQKKHDGFRPVYNSNTENLCKITVVAKGY